MDNNIDLASQAVVYTGAGSLVLSLIIWFIRKAFKDINSTLTDNSQQGASRAQVELLREEIGRLETLVQRQSDKLDKLNSEIVKLRLAFIDEQSALLRILAEFNAHGDSSMKARISAEIEAANRRRLAVLGVEAQND